MGHIKKHIPAIRRGCYELQTGHDGNQHVDAGFHVLNRDILEAAMVILAAGAEVGARQAFVGQSCAVGTTTYMQGSMHFFILK